MPIPPDPRLARLLRDLDRLAKLIDELQTDLLAYMRDSDITWDELGECYDPPKSRQAISKWFATRQQRKAKQR